MGEEQIGRAVQRDGGLAGSWTALHEQNAGQGVPDDLVLLTLDSGHDVTHAPGTGATQGGQQGAGPTQGEPSIDESLVGGVALAVVGQLQLTEFIGEVLVLDAQHLAATNGHVTTTCEAERLHSGRAIERLGHRCAPVHHQGVEFHVGHREATHVIGIAGALVLVEVVNATKKEGLVTDRELVESLQRGAHHHVTFHEVARPAHGRHGGRVAKGTCLGAHVVQGVQRSVEELLFLVNLTLVSHRTSLSTRK